MSRRILSIIIIMLLLFTISTPLTGSIFSYADGQQEETLTNEQLAEAAIAVYLNKRNAYIVNDSGTAIETVQGVMESWINSYEFWTDHTNVGGIAEFYASCIVKYNPFRISLKGPAVRALNDLYDWLIESGKLGNLENSNGGQTSDSLYSGLNYSGTNFYMVNGSPNDNNKTYKNLSDATIGTPVHGVTHQTLLNYALTNNGGMSLSTFIGDNSGYQQVTYTMNYFSDRSYTFYLARGGNSSNETRDIRPCLYLNNTLSTSYINQLGCAVVQSFGNDTVMGNPAYIHFNGNNKNYIGFACLNYTAKKIGFFTFGQITAGSYPFTNANVNLDTDNFDKTNPTPPEDDDEIEYTPEDKDTGNTYNTYNQYITNYVQKKTIIRNTEPEPSPGGTTPPWDGGDTTVTPDPGGGGGYDISLPDLTLPDLDIDWSINGLKDKFPFSIPWDLMAFFTVLNAEPETPAIEGRINLGIVDWDIDWDLHEFDSLAALLRNLEFIGFCIALILITRNIIKG